MPKDRSKSQKVTSEQEPATKKQKIDDYLPEETLVQAALDGDDESSAIMEALDSFKEPEETVIAKEKDNLTATHRDQLLQEIADSPGMMEELESDEIVGEDSPEPQRGADAETLAMQAIYGEDAPELEEIPDKKAPVDPEAAADLIAQRMMRETFRQALKAGEEDRAGRDRHGRRLPQKDGVRRLPKKIGPRRRRYVDPRSIDPSLLTEGHVPRWVRLVDGMGHNKPSPSRVREFKAYGYTVIKDPATGKPLVSDYGVAMQGPPDGYAERVMDYTPVGAMNKDELMGDVLELEKDLNRSARRKHGTDTAVKLRQRTEHGRSRQIDDSAVED